MNPKLFWLITAIALVFIQPIEAQQAKKIPRIGLLTVGARASTTEEVEAFRDELRELGYTEGRNVSFEYRYAEGIDERLPSLAAELVELKVDVIRTRGTPATQAAKNATTTIPIVMTDVSDPLGAGLVASLAHPGGNVTWLTNVLSDLGGKQLELITEVLPKASRVAVLWDSANAGNVTWLEQMKATARALRITLQPLDRPPPRGFGVCVVSHQKRSCECPKRARECRHSCIRITDRGLCSQKQVANDVRG